MQRSVSAFQTLTASADPVRIFVSSELKQTVLGTDGKMWHTLVINVPLPTWRRYGDPEMWWSVLVWVVSLWVCEALNYYPVKPAAPVCGVHTHVCSWHLKRRCWHTNNSPCQQRISNDLQTKKLISKGSSTALWLWANVAWDSPCFWLALNLADQLQHVCFLFAFGVQTYCLLMTVK